MDAIPAWETSRQFVILLLMRNRVQIALAVLLVVIVGFVTWPILRSRAREPVYQGKRLSIWLKQYHDALEDPWSPATSGTTLMGMGEGASAAQAQAAIRAIGTNALPALLEMAKAHESFFERKLTVLYYHQLLLSLSAPAKVLHRMAGLGFYTLGSEAKPAVAGLTQLLGDRQPDVRFGAAKALGFIGNAARGGVPRLIECLHDSDGDTRWAAAEALKRIDAEAVAKTGVK